MSRRYLALDGYEFDISNLYSQDSRRRRQGNSQIAAGMLRSSRSNSSYRDSMMVIRGHRARHSTLEDTRKRNSSLRCLKYPSLSEIPSLYLEDPFANDELAGSFSPNSAVGHETPRDNGTTPQCRRNQADMRVSDGNAESASIQDDSLSPPQWMEILPNQYLPMRDEQETWSCFMNGRAVDVTCVSCQSQLFTVEDAELVLCSHCHMVSPVDRAAAQEDGCLGVGMTFEQACQRLEGGRNTKCQSYHKCDAGRQQQSPARRRQRERLGASGRSWFHCSSSNSLHSSSETLRLCPRST